MIIEVSMTIVTGQSIPRRWREAYDIITKVVTIAAITLDDPIPQECPKCPTASTQRPVGCPTIPTATECPECPVCHTQELLECPTTPIVTECPKCPACHTPEPLECPTTTTVTECPTCITPNIETTTPTPRACSGNRCDNSGSCVDHLDGGFHCVCHPGFADHKCSSSKSIQEYLFPLIIPAC